MFLFKVQFLRKRDAKNHPNNRNTMNGVDCSDFLSPYAMWLVLRKQQRDLKERQKNDKNRPAGGQMTYL